MAEKLNLLIPEAEVRAAIARLGTEISRDFSDITEENPLLCLCTLRGAVYFACELTRVLTIPIRLDFIKLCSYSGTRPAGAPLFELGENLDLNGRDVLILEDIVDTGQTIDTVLRTFERRGARRLRVCALLDKPSRRDPRFAHVKPDYTGFEIEDLFVVGWGLDYNDRYRTLTDIMYLEF